LTDMNAMKVQVVTIERMTACGGLYIGRRLAAHLGVPCLDQEILAGAARRLRQDEQQLAGRDERVLSFGRKLLVAFSAGTPENDYAPPPFPFPEDEELFAAETKVIREAVRSGTGTVIIGHGGSSILKTLPGVARVFCHAPLPYRVRRLMTLYGISDEHEARRAVEEQDRARERYLKAVTGTNWREADQYDLCINTSAFGLDAAVDVILEYLRAIGNPERPAKEE
jgi:hypothetical protein